MALPPDFPGKEDIKHLQANTPDLSPSATVIAFDPILPLLRLPIPAGKEDDPSKGPFVLAFRDEGSWRRAWRTCEGKIIAQCEAGARMGCSIRATNACKIPWWRYIFSFTKPSNKELEDREACEEREMMACLAVSKEECTAFARGTCEPVFAEMRIAEPTQVVDSRFTRQRPRKIRLTRRMMMGKSLQNCQSVKSSEECQSVLLPDSADDESRFSVSDGPTNFRGKRLIGEKSNHRLWEGPIWSGVPQNADYSKRDQVLEGWEGGLIRPKSKLDNKMQEPTETEKRPFWHAIWQEICSRARGQK